MTTATTTKCYSPTQNGGNCHKNVKAGYNHCTQHVAVHLSAGVPKKRLQAN